MHTQKICVSKKYTFIGIVALLALILTVLNYRFLQVKKTTSSRADEMATSAFPTIIPPATVSSDPKQILLYWIADALVLKGQTIMSSVNNNADSGHQKLFATLRNVNPSAKYMTLGELVADSDATDLCTFGSPQFYSPLTALFSQFGSNSLYLRAKNLPSNPEQPLHLTFLQNTNNGEIDAFMSSWENGQPIAIKRIPYQAFLHAFSQVLQSDGIPFTTALLRGDGFSSSETCIPGGVMSQWEHWVQYVAADSSLSDVLPLNGQVYVYPTPTSLPPYTNDQTGFMAQKINTFTRQFEVLVQSNRQVNIQVGGHTETVTLNMPEVAIGPSIHTAALGGGITVTYYLNNDNFNSLKVVLNALGELSPAHNPTPEPTVKPLGNAITSYAYYDRTFINYLYSSCATDYFSSGTNENSSLRCSFIPINDRNRLAVNAHSGIAGSQKDKNGNIMYDNALLLQFKNIEKSDNDNVMSPTIKFYTGE